MEDGQLMSIELFHQCFIQLLLILRGFLILRSALEPWALHQALFHFGFCGEKGGTDQGACSV